jgi:hypothetical protein
MSSGFGVGRETAVFAGRSTEEATGGGRHEADVQVAAPEQHEGVGGAHILNETSRKPICLPIR